MIPSKSVRYLETGAVVQTRVEMGLVLKLRKERMNCSPHAQNGSLATHRVLGFLLHLA